MADFLDSVTPPSATHSRPMPVREDCWCEEATFTLVDAWGHRFLELSRRMALFLRRKDWQDVADAVNTLHGHTKKTRRTDVQCKNRVDTVKKKYKIEKARVLSSNGAFCSAWSFFERLDVLIGSNFNAKKSSPSRPAALPLSYSKIASPPSPVPARAVALPQKRLAASVMDDGYFRRNYSAVAAAAAAAEADEDEDEEDGELEEDDEKRSEVEGGDR